MEVATDTKRHQLLARLRGGSIVLNLQLNKICFAYSQRIGDLVRNGIDIESLSAKDLEDAGIDVKQIMTATGIKSKRAIHGYRLVTPWNQIDFENLRVKPITVNSQGQMEMRI